MSKTKTGKHQVTKAEDNLQETAQKLENYLYQELLEALNKNNQVKECQKNVRPTIACS